MLGEWDGYHRNIHWTIFFLLLQKCYFCFCDLLKSLKIIFVGKGCLGVGKYFKRSIGDGDDYSVIQSNEMDGQKWSNKSDHVTRLLECYIVNKFCDFNF